MTLYYRLRMWAHARRRAAWVRAFEHHNGRAPYRGEVPF